jgi:YafQ family addiction module toxin component
MNNYTANYTKTFQKDLKKFKKNFNLQQRLIEKRDEILKNPTRYKPLRNVLKGKMRVHISSYVLTFEVDETQKTVIFHKFRHHDKVYKKTT